MAILPRGENGEEWAILEIDSVIHILENPGLPTESVHFIFPISKDTISIVMQHLFDTSVLSDIQKSWAIFWMGYFYAHLGAGNASI